MIFFIDILSGLISSFIFIFLILFLLKPKIKISNQISKQIDSNEVIYFRIKFLNKSIFPAYDLKMEIREIIEINAEPYGKNVIEENKINIKTNNMFWVGRYIPSFLVKNYAEHAIQIKITENIEEILKDPFRSIELRISAKHGLSGLTGYSIKVFPTDLCIKEGPYEFGNSMRIIEI